MTQVLFALNREYCLNEKGAVLMADSFAVGPRDFRSRVEGSLAALAGMDPDRSIDTLESLEREIAGLSPALPS